jgi:DNA (cytosine-5)-methyltransferase 1
MKVLSLFSGVGGFDMGLENAGMETVFQCEWDKHANSILYKHWPDVPKWDDVSTLTGKHILAHAPVVDVVAWGSPCQDLSVAGKRAGLEGGRSGLFHEGIRIIKELQEESNGQYPRISIWENVVGALNSNRGADFGIILDEMAEAGALAIEWSVLDAQYFGIPQRRRRVFVIAIFDPVLANRCPNPLLPVAESLPGHLAKGKQARKSAATTLTEGVRTDGAWWDGRDTAEALTTTSNEQRMPDKQRFQAVVEGFTPSSFADYSDGVGTLRSNGGDLGGGERNIVGSLQARDYKGIGNQYVEEGKIVIEPSEPFVKSSRAQTSDDSETWIPGEVNPTLNSFDVGDTRATTAIIEELVLFENSFRDGARIALDGVTQTLTSKMGTGGGNTPMIAIGIQGNVIGRQDHNGPAGKGHTDEGDPMFTLTSTDIHAVAISEPTLAFDTQFGSNANVTENVSHTLKASQQSPSVAYPIDTRNALRDPEKYDAQNRQGLGIGADGDPMATLTSAHVNAVAYDEYNDTTNDVHHALRAGTKQSTGVLISPTLTAYNMDSRSPQSEEQQRIVAAVHEATMAVRRLTPLECERLMGWPDDHTRYKADGTEQADTHRYKQCGNGVASPVAQWIAKHILNI